MPAFRPEIAWFFREQAAASLQLAGCENCLLARCRIIGVPGTSVPRLKSRVCAVTTTPRMSSTSSPCYPCSSPRREEGIDTAACLRILQVPPENSVQTDAPAKLLIEKGVMTEAEFLAKTTEERRRAGTLIATRLEVKVWGRLCKTTQEGGQSYQSLANRILAGVMWKASNQLALTRRPC